MEKSYWRRYWPPMMWAVLLFGLSSIPKLDSPIHLSRWDDKYGHVLIYLPLGFLLMRSLMQSRTAPRNGDLTRQAVIAIVLGIVFGISDEIHQYFVPGRFMDWRDAVADGAGVILGALIYLKIRRKQERRRHAPHHSLGRELWQENSSR